MTHAERARAFAADRERARWHDGALWSVRAKRDRAAARLPEWEVLREVAAAGKRDALARLPELLERFEERATALGARVHWARDAEEHNRIVHGLLAERGVRKVVKSKSMLTEECGLNPYLEARGVEVVDSDLGERIVQLRREPPSHIVLPAIHLRRREVGELFERSLGTPPGEDEPERLVEAARAALRRHFLEADAGITGVNFAVAETGGLVVCTNEGNADLGVALPPLHVACMGLEKVIPGPAELAVLLRLLARSATGQASTAYTAHFHGPRPGGELHVVIVDGGRSRLLAHPRSHRSLACIRCGACLNTCPVFRRSGGHSYGSVVPGPIGSIWGPAREPRVHAGLPFACTACGSCSDVCPVKIDLHPQLLAWRGEVVRRRAVPLRRRLALAVASRILARPGLSRRAGALVRRLLRRPRLADRLLPAWSRGRAWPEPPAGSFREQWRHGRRRGAR